MTVSVVGDGDLYYFKGGEWRSLVESPPIGENVSGASILDVCRNWTLETDMSYPNYGGTATVNSVNVGLFDYVYKTGNQTPTSDMSEWFTGSNDARSAWVLVDGDLTIGSEVMFRPPARKLFTVVYVTGDLAVNGELTMTSRGANHSGTGESGGATTAADIRIATGTFSGVVDPQVPAAGGGGAAGVLAGSNANVNGTNGSAGSAGGTGGGGSGGAFGTNSTSGAGAGGTSFCGGAGGGGIVVTTGATNTAEPGGADGGKGGDPVRIGNNAAGAGGGNPGGVNTTTGLRGVDGIGGVLVVIVEGELSGSGTISANSLPNLNAAFRTGGGMGGGSVTVLYGTDTSSITPSASGSLQLLFAQLSTGSAYGGGGGAGTARKLAL